jgi:hypothetical protein
MAAIDKVHVTRIGLIIPRFVRQARSQRRASARGGLYPSV